MGLKKIISEQKNIYIYIQNINQYESLYVLGDRGTYMLHIVQLHELNQIKPTTTFIHLKSIQPNIE